MVEHTSTLLWSLMLVKTCSFRVYIVPRQLSFMKQWTVPVAKKTKDGDLGTHFNVICFMLRSQLQKKVIF